MPSRIAGWIRTIPQGPWILGASIAVAVLVAPFAVAQSSLNGNGLRGGARNPSTDQRQAYTKETEIIADTSTYGTRQSNKSSSGGGAVYGCRSGLGGTEKNNEPCIRANNLEDGRAFEFASSGKNATEVGRITAQNPNAAPLTTNAVGVATGFNADQVDGKHASDIVSEAQALNRFAAVGTTGGLAAGRDADTSAKTATGTYLVTFKSDLSKCAYQATETIIEDGGAAAVQPTGPTTIQVRTRDAAGAAADRPFHLLVTC